MGPMQKIPQGLIGFLQLKTVGQNPSALADAVSPTWDLRDLYLETEAQYLDLSSTLNGTGYTIFFSAEQLEVLWVTDVAIRITSGAAEALSCHAARSSANNAGVVPMGPETFLGASATLVINFPRFIILEPGESLGLTATSVVGVIDVTGAMRFVRLPL